MKKNVEFNNNVNFIITTYVNLKIPIFTRPISIFVIMILYIGYFHIPSSGFDIFKHILIPNETKKVYFQFF